MKIRPVEVA